jgi:hypothetical protein
MSASASRFIGRVQWPEYADNAVAGLRRLCAGRFMPNMKWPVYAEHGTTSSTARWPDYAEYEVA